MPKRHRVKVESVQDFLENGKKIDRTEKTEKNEPEQKKKSFFMKNGVRRKILLPK